MRVGRITLERSPLQMGLYGKWARILMPSLTLLVLRKREAVGKKASTRRADAYKGIGTYLQRGVGGNRLGGGGGGGRGGRGGGGGGPQNPKRAVEG